MSYQLQQKYRFYCLTESNFVYAWDTQTPSVCPNGIDHTIDVNSITVLDSKRSILYDSNAVSDVLSSSSASGSNNSGLSNDQLSAYGSLKCARDHQSAQLDFRTITSLSNNLYATLETRNGGFLSSNSSLVILNSGTSTNSFASLTSENYVNTNCEGGNVVFDGLFSVGRNGNRRFIGAGTSSNGLMFGYLNSNFGVLRRTRGVNNFTPQAQWNVDAMNGTGPSGLVLNPATGNIYRIQYQSAGFGMSRFYVANMGSNSSNGEFILVHQLGWANSNTVVDIDNTSLPLYVENSNVTSTINSTVATSWMYGSTESRRLSQARPIYSLVNTRDQFVNNQAIFFTIRNKATVNGFRNQSCIKLKNFTVTSTKMAPIVQFYLLRNATLSVLPMWTDVDSNSIVEYDITATSATGGVLIGKYCSYRSDIIPLEKTNIRLGPGESLTAGVVINGMQLSYTFGAAIVWEEDK